MIGRVSYRELRTMGVEGLKKMLHVNGGIIFVTVDGELTFVLQSYPFPALAAYLKAAELQIEN